MAPAIASPTTLIPPKPFRSGLGFGTASLSPSFPSSLVACPRMLSRRWKPLAIGRAKKASASLGMEEEGFVSPWEDKPCEILPGGRRRYLDEQDVVSFLDPPKELIPLDPESYNPAAYLWKKIGDIPEERRHQLLYMMNDRLIARIWGISGTRYQDAKLAKKSASTLVSMGDSSIRLEYWSCQTSKEPLPIAWIKDFKKVIFHGKDGGIYGRILLSGPVTGGLANIYGPLYFTVRQAVEVVSTEQPCDLAFEFGNGLLDIDDFPKGFPKPVEHRWPFNDHFVIYLRHAGPGVMVGQAWQEGKDLEQVPKKFCEILMVNDYLSG